MKNSWPPTWLHRRYLAAILGGFLLSTSFAPLNWTAAAWVAPGLILFSALGGDNTFRLGFAAGFVHFVSSLYWLLHMPFTWRGIPLAPGLAWLALSGYCALYPAIWVWACWKLLPNVSNTRDFVAVSWARRLGWTLAAGAIWTGLEYGRGLFLTGFPWNFIAASQYQMLPLIQIAAFTGIYGVSFIVVWTSVSLWSGGFVFMRQPGRHSLWGNAGASLLVVVIVMVFGLSKLVGPKEPGNLSVVMVQPSIPQTLIFDPAGDEARFQDLLNLTKKAMASHPQLVLWPESAVPDITPEIQQAIARLAQSNHIWLAFVTGTTEPTPTDPNAYFCSALFCDPEGQLQGVYHKRRLVIFGEYIPFVRWLPFLKILTSVATGITPGDRVSDFRMQNPSAKMSILICFEDMFAQEARDHVGPDTDFLVNLTNDGWFGHGPEQWQQAASGIFRAVENGIPILRCTNDGLTCWADAQGRIQQIFSRSGNVYGEGFLTASIPLRAAGLGTRTFYNQYGDWFPALCSGIGTALVAATFLRTRRMSSGTAKQDTVQN